MAEAPFDIPKAHRWFGIQLNNSTMDALDAGLVTAETAEPYIHAAHASCHHWMQVGTVANHGRGEFAVASVYAAAGLGEAALRHARRYLELFEANPAEMEDWDKAFAYDSLARAYAAAGNTQAARQARAQARAAGDAIADEEDRTVFLNWFEGGQWHGLAREP
ncbi:MAG: hypothetical protein OXO48_07320 [Caldilineaceae bacterium]|nr:hypothetical protein [Caldilineaceae bacterium]MDE0429094.1 hypothetical protein [Caldilineaceae bacterium]